MGMLGEFGEVGLRISPASSGWWLECDIPIEPSFFQSGARAEESARALAVRLCESGRDVRLTVFDRNDIQIAVHRYMAE